MTNEARKAMLIILDGWGIGRRPEADAIRKAHTPTMDALCTGDLDATLVTYGEAVGLPEGQMGNSEVGHMHIGAGRVIYQDLLNISKAINENRLKDRPMIQQLLARIKNGRLHLMGLVSDGGVHAHINHLLGVIDLVQAERPEIQVYLHLFTDGRDTGPKTGLRFIQRVVDFIDEMPRVRIASVIGRYFAMDRDRRWERTHKAYQLLVHGIGEQEADVLQAMQAQYEGGATDEFIEPIIFESEGCVKDEDTVFFFNFRSDRPRQLTSMLVEAPEPCVNTQPLALDFYTMTQYDEDFKKVHVVFSKSWPSNTLGEWLAKHGRSQLRAAETEKYPHVTYFFSGGDESPLEGEDRALIHSPKVATYDLQPSMSAAALTEEVAADLLSAKHDFICVNFANADMVGHTGVFDAAVEACAFVDSCVRQLLEAAKGGYHVIIIADHGNADLMVNPDGSPHTAHTTNPVPVVLIDADGTQVKAKDGSLIDVAPTILDMMNVPLPDEMQGQSLIER